MKSHFEVRKCENVFNTRKRTKEKIAVLWVEVTVVFWIKTSCFSDLGEYLSKTERRIFFDWGH